MPGGVRAGEQRIASQFSSKNLRSPRQIAAAIFFVEARLRQPNSSFELRRASYVAARFCVDRCKGNGH
jgi:hypothetical protein